MWKAGSVIGGHEVVKRLGSGFSSTVYDANPADPVAIKVYRSGSANERYFRNEVRMLSAIASAGGHANLVKFLGCGAHIESKADGTPVIHPFITFDLAGLSLEKLLHLHEKDGRSGLPAVLADNANRGMFAGLQFLHTQGIIHTDIKPGNILIDCSAEQALANPAAVSVKLADMGSSTLASKLFSMHIGSGPYIAPEIILEQEYTNAVDIWAACCVAYELYTGELLFDVENEFNIKYGVDVADMFEDVVFEDSGSSDAEDSDSETSADLAEIMGVHSGESSCDSCAEKSQESAGSLGSNSDWSFDTKQPDNWASKYRHLALINKLVGYPPEEFADGAPKYYSATGRLLLHPHINTLSITRLIKKNYKSRDYDEKQLDAFVSGGLRYMPAEREEAAWFISHPFLTW